MRHVSTIKKIISSGNREEALVAIDNLLALGPNNTDALKLKAMIFASEGKFQEESSVWHRVLKVDREDEDAIAFVLKQQNEDREHFYFTDPLPNGGRRYLAYPKSLFYAAIFGLMGCVSFVSISRLTSVYQWLAEPYILLAAFATLVLTPWLAIIWGWARSLKSLVIHPSGIIAETRFKLLNYPFTDLQDVILAYDGDPYDPQLSLVLRLKKEESQKDSKDAMPDLLIDLTESSSSLRARSHMIRQIVQHTPLFRHAPLTTLNLSRSGVRRF
jgi:hypothetical protein